MPLTHLEERLRPIARNRIEKGTLPCEQPYQMFGGKGSGKPCSLCGEPIPADQIEYEVQRPGTAGGPKGELRFHIVCESIWLLECARRDHLLKHPRA
jgi:hypothetical protein